MQHLFTNRFGGVSKAPYESLNLGQHVGDDPQDVEKNRELLREKLGVSKLVFMDQVHGDKIVVIETGDEMPICDAMITKVPHIGLVVMAADCIPILLYDQAHHAIGVAHAGRKGTLLKVGQKCALAMQEHFGSTMEAMQIFMGPSIKQCCYEVGHEAIEGFEGFVQIKEGRFFLDLQNYNREAFLSLGIKEEHITISDVCSCCDENYFSYRREHMTGRFAGVICL